MNRRRVFLDTVSARPELCFVWVLFCFALTKMAESAEIDPNSKTRISHVSPLGVTSYRSGRWGVLNLHLVNPTSEAVDLLALTHFQDEPTLQYGRKIWAPAKSRRQMEQPVRLPSESPASAKGIEFRTSLVNPHESREVFIRSDSDALQWDGLLPLASETLVTGLIDTPSSSPNGLFDDVPENAESAYELVIASQVASDQKLRLTVLHENRLPFGEESLHALDQLVIANNRIVEDETGIEAVRRWLFGGGRLWIMLDRVDPSVLAQLLGDEVVYEFVDRISLTTVRIESSDGHEKASQEFESPVDLVRLTISDVDVTHRVEGWPAAFSKRVGEGRLLVTTLAPRGWMRLRNAADNRSNSRPQSSGTPSQSERPTSDKVGSSTASATQNSRPVDARPPTSKFVVLEPMATIASEFFVAPPAQLVSETALEPLVQEYIGYSVLPQWQAAGLLIGFCALLGVLAFLLWKQSRLELLAAAAPCIALTTSGVFVLFGHQQRRAVPPVVSSMQFVKPISGTDDVSLEGFAGLFSPDIGAASVSSTNGGRFMPDMTGMQGTTRRMVWTDLGEWHWEHLPQTAGIRPADFRISTNLGQPLAARATFGPEGLTGHLSIASAYRVSDPILATRQGRLGVDLQAGGEFVVQSQNVFSAEQFLAAGLLSDEQNRRRRLLQSLLTSPQRLDFPPEPTLLFWTEPWDIGFHFNKEQRSVGAALVAVPLRFERPPGGTEISIASPFLPFQSVVGPDESIPSPMWDGAHRIWIERSAPSAAWLRFQVPRSLLPIAIQRGKLQVQIKGPVGKLEIAGFQPSTKMIVPVKTWIDPVGTLSLEISDTELLRLSEDGGLLLRVSGGDPDRPELTQAAGSESSMSYWQIESLTLELIGKTADVAKQSSAPAGVQ